MLTLSQIKAAVLQGKNVYWKSPVYVVENHGDDWLVHCTLNDTYHGLVDRRTGKLQGELYEFMMDSREALLAFYEQREAAMVAKIVAEVNEVTGLNLEPVERLESWNIKCQDAKGKHYVIVAYGTMDNVTVRSILKRRGRSAMFWGPNGDAGKGSISVASWAEDEFEVIQ